MNSKQQNKVWGNIVIKEDILDKVFDNILNENDITMLTKSLGMAINKRVKYYEIFYDPKNIEGYEDGLDRKMKEASKFIYNYMKIENNGGEFADDYIAFNAVVGYICAASVVNNDANNTLYAKRGDVLYLYGYKITLLTDITAKTLKEMSKLAEKRDEHIPWNDRLSYGFESEQAFDEIEKINKYRPEELYFKNIVWTKDDVDSFGAALKDLKPFHLEKVTYINIDNHDYPYLTPVDYLRMFTTIAALSMMTDTKNRLFFHNLDEERLAKLERSNQVERNNKVESDDEAEHDEVENDDDSDEESQHDNDPDYDGEGIDDEDKFNYEEYLDHPSFQKIMPNLKRITVDNFAYGYIDGDSSVFYCKEYILLDMRPSLDLLVYRNKLIPIVETSTFLEYYIKSLDEIDTWHQFDFSDMNKHITLSPHITDDNHAKIQKYIDDYNFNTAHISKIAIVDIPKDIYG